jgi:hypothetical protein
VALSVAAIVGMSLFPEFFANADPRSASHKPNSRTFSCSGRSLDVNRINETTISLYCNAKHRRSGPVVDGATAQSAIRLAPPEPGAARPPAVPVPPGSALTVECGDHPLAYWHVRDTRVAVLCQPPVVSVPTPTPTEPTPTDEPTTPPATTAPPTATPTSSTSAPSAPGTAPSKPIAQVCTGSSTDGPAKAPDGAVSVSPSQDLGDVVKAHDAHTTYWLAPGTYTLGTGAYDQVIPQAGDRFIGAPGAIVDGRHKNQYAFTGSAAGVTIEHLTIQNFGATGGNNNEGVVNHDSAKNWTLTGNVIQKNAGSGVMIGSGDKLTGNCIRDNGQYAFNAYSPNGVSDIVLTGNEISGNNTDNWEKRQPGCGCTGGGKFWATNGGVVTGNYVHDNKGVGLWADTNNANFLFQGNYIADNDDEGLMYETSYNAAILNNTFVRNALVKGPTNPGFPASAIYLSESGSDSRVAGPYGSVFKVSGNVFTDNWAGIVAWENADRFAGSPANSSTGTTTLVAPKSATVTACGNSATLKSSSSLLDDCRWKVKNLLVEDNTFNLDAGKISGCTQKNGCGFNGLFSNYGSYPSWSPYKGDIVPNHITFDQNNVFKNNAYHGPWGFVIKQGGNIVSWAAWRAAPYKQDAGSTLSAS